MKQAHQTLREREAEWEAWEHRRLINRRLRIARGVIIAIGIGLMVAVVISNVVR